MPSAARMAKFGATHVEGSPELMAKLQSVPGKIANKAIRKGVRAAGKIILEETKSRAPVKTGTLKKMLAVRTSKPKKGRLGIKVGYKKGDELVRMSKEGKRYYYPAAVEYGKKGVGGLHFQKESFEAKKDQATQTFGDTVGQVLEAEGKK